MIPAGLATVIQTSQGTHPNPNIACLLFILEDHFGRYLLWSTKKQNNIPLVSKT